MTNADLSGLSGLRDADADDDGEPQLSFCVEMRLDMLTSVLELLCHLNVLDRVGEELLHAGARLHSCQRIRLAIGDW